MYTVFLEIENLLRIFGRVLHFEKQKSAYL
jgi:hypothetical protein